MISSNCHQKKYESWNSKPRKFKLMLVGVPVQLKRKDLFDFFSYILKSKSLFFEMKKKKDSKKNQGWAVMHVPTRGIYERVLSQGSFFIGQKKISAKKYMKGRELKIFREQLKRRRVFLKGVPLKCSDEDIHNFFSEFGEVEDAYCIKRKFQIKNPSINSRCYALVIFKKKEDAENLLKRGIKLVLFGALIEVQQFRTKQEKNIQGNRVDQGRQNSMTGGLPEEGFNNKAMNSQLQANQNLGLYEDSRAIVDHERYQNMCNSFGCPLNGGIRHQNRIHHGFDFYGAKGLSGNDQYQQKFTIKRSKCRPTKAQKPNLDFSCRENNTMGEILSKRNLIKENHYAENIKICSKNLESKNPDTFENGFMGFN